MQVFVVLVVWGVCAWVLTLFLHAIFVSYCPKAIFVSYFPPRRGVVTTPMEDRSGKTMISVCVPKKEQADRVSLSLEVNRCSH